MEQTAKQLYENMVDYKRFAVFLLAVGVFFYFGVIIPSDTKLDLTINMMMSASSLFLSGAIFFFTRSKACKNKLMDTEEGQEYLMKK